MIFILKNLSFSLTFIIDLISSTSFLKDITDIARVTGHEKASRQFVAVGCESTQVVTIRKEV